MIIKPSDFDSQMPYKAKLGWMSKVFLYHFIIQGMGKAKQSLKTLTMPNPDS
jgi:hypothetical protein